MGKIEKFKEDKKTIDIDTNNGYHNERGDIKHNKFAQNTSSSFNTLGCTENVYDTIGDRTKECIENGLKDADYYLNNSTNNNIKKESIQNASIKLALSNETGNKKMQGIAFNELNTLLASGKPDMTIPLGEYINEKENWDYKNGNYSTTKYISSSRDESVASIQHQLNEIGCTDKFDNPLKEDGLLGAKTMQALQRANREDFGVELYNALRFREGSETTSVAPMAFIDGFTNGQDSYSVNLKNKPSTVKPDTTKFYDYTRLSKSQYYNSNVTVLQQKLVDAGYLKVPDGEWGYYGEKTEAAVNKYKEDNKIYNKGKDKGVVGRCTWEYMGLPYLTSEDISNGLSVKIVNRRAYYDVSSCINNALNNAVRSFKFHNRDFIWFASKVKSKAEWDIKLKEVWENTIDCKYPGSSNAKVYFYGTLITPEALGNITYGYLGSAAGFTQEELLFGGDAAAGGFGFSLNGIVNGTKGILGRADSEEDKKNIIYGINWYKSTQKNKKGVVIC